MKPKKLPKVVLETLQTAGWKNYEGDNPMYQNNWINGNRVMAIHPSSMGQMYHVSPDLSNLEKRDEMSFLHQSKLLNLIRGEND